MSTGLIPDEARAAIGSLLHEPLQAEITARDAQRYAHAVDDLNPVYFDEEAARAAGYRTLVVPPTFVSHAVVPTRPLSDLREDGLFRSGHNLGLRVQRVMAGGDEWDFLAPVHVGDVITAEARLHDLEEREGRTGPFVKTVVEVTYTNQDGEVVARLRQVGIAR